MRAKLTGRRDTHDCSAGSWRWCAGGPLGYRGWRRSGAGPGLSAPHGPAPSAGHFAFYLVASNWTGSLAGILEAGPGGFACRNFVRAGNATRRLRGESDSPPHAIPELERIVRLLPGAGGIATVEEGGAAADPGNIFGRYRRGNPGEENQSAKYATDFCGDPGFARRVAGGGRLVALGAENPNGRFTLSHSAGSR